MMRSALAALTVLVTVGAAHGFELLRVNHDPCARQDQNLFWPAASVPVSVDALGEPYRSLAIDAWNRWNLSLGRFRFTSGHAAACQNDGIAAMAIDDTPCGLGDFGDALAITRSIWNGDGRLVDADVTFRSNSFVLGNQPYFRQVAMHELGHVLGLDHSDACGASGQGTLMRSVLTGRPLEAPQADDVSGADTIYPGAATGGGGGTVPEGANSCAIVAPERTGSVGALLLPIPLLLMRRRSRRIDGPRILH